MTLLPSENLTIDQAIAKAIQATKQGEENVARELYHAVLKHQPNHRIARKNLSKLNAKRPTAQIEKSQIATPLQSQILDLVNLFHSNEMVRTEDGCRALLQTHPKSFLSLRTTPSSGRSAGFSLASSARFTTASSSRTSTRSIFSAAMCAIT